MKHLIWAMVFVVSIVLENPVRGQPNKILSTSVIKGTVTDQNGTPLAFANVYLQETMEGTMSDDKGCYSITSRAVGRVTLVCSYIGYQNFKQAIHLKAGQTLPVNIELQQEAVKARPITITASAFTAADEEGVTLTSLDVVRTPGAAADVFWAVKSFPGLQQVEEGAGLFVRGGDVSETVIYLDGAIINHPYKYESPTGGFFGTFSPFLLKGTFFSSGGFSARYGNALSGTLAMESQNMPDRRQMALGIGLAAESIYLAFPVVKDQLGFSLSGNWSNTKMMFDLNKARRTFSQYPFSYDLNLNVVYRLNSTSNVKFFLFREDDKIGVKVDDPDYSTHFHGDASNRFYNIKFSSLLSRTFLLQMNIAVSDFGQRMHLGVMDLDVTDRLYQARLVCEWEPFKTSTLRMGMDFFRYHTLTQGVVPQEELDLAPDAPTDCVDTDYVSNRAVQYIEWELFGPFGLQITPGLRGEYESISEIYRVDPRISLNYPMTLHSNISAAWGIYRQFPKPEYYDPYVGNPNLSSMRAVHYILGYAYQKENRIFRLEAYYKEYQDLLLEDESLNYVNEGLGQAKGIDVFVKDEYGPVSGWVAYSWLHARRQWMDSPVVAPPYFDITHNLTVVTNLDLPKYLTLGLSFRHATGKPYTPGPDKYHEARVPDYQKLDVSLSYLHSFFDGNVTVFYVAVSNLLNRINIFDYRYSEDWQRREAEESSFGRAVYFGFSFNM